MNLTENQLQAFWDKVDKKGPTECWAWKGAKKKRGYGNIKFDGKMRQAHVVSWAIAHGEYPEFFVLHSCDNPSCVNPNHLFEGTHCENMEDMRRKGRGSKKLTAKEALVIRSAKGTYQEIATMHGISRQTVSQIKKGQTWALI